jgi:hypothetical protein
MHAGTDIELVAVPGADHVHPGFGERHPLAGAIFGDDLFDLGDHLALADWSAHVRTQVEIGEELAIELEDRDFKALEADDFTSGVGKVRRRSNVHLAHLGVSAIALPG